jgi:L-lactate dehydrogenase (cytochrome)
MRPASIDDYRILAQRRLPRFLFEYLDGGSYAETTMHQNATDLANIQLRQRVMRNVSAIDLSTTLFGQHLSMPVVLGPVGLAGINARRGEVQAACAAQAAGIPFCLSTVSVCPIAEVASATSDPIWFQLYMIRDRPFMADLLDKAAAVGCKTLVLTVDMPVPGSRYRDYRSSLAGAPGVVGSLRRFGQAALRPRWTYDVGLCGRPHGLGNIAPILGPDTGLEDFFDWMRGNFDPSVTWADLEWVRSRWNGTIIIKGILDPEDALAAADAGVDGIVVSNHGGRQLDGVPSTATALPPIVAAVGNRVIILADGGVRSGLDVVRMLALGAKSVLLGRAWAYGLAGGGGAGVEHVLSIIRAEMMVAMALCGRTAIAAIDRHMLVNAGQVDSRPL